jgi:hypothetical protein
MMTQFRELSVLPEIAYLDPELNGKVGYLESYLPRARAWGQIHRLVTSPCVMALGVFMVLLVIGMQLAN